MLCFCLFQFFNNFTVHPMAKLNLQNYLVCLYMAEGKHLLKINEYALSNLTQTPPLNTLIGPILSTINAEYFVKKFLI